MAFSPLMIRYCPDSTRPGAEVSVRQEEIPPYIIYFLFGPATSETDYVLCTTLM